MTDEPTHTLEEPAASPTDGPTRRALIKGAAGLAAASVVLGRPNIVRAAADNPVKMGFIEDQSGNLSIYGIQKLHAAQLAVQEINDGFTLPAVRSDRRPGNDGDVSPTPPTLAAAADGKLTVVNDGGKPDKPAIVGVDQADILISSGEKGLLGRPLDLISSDGQSNNTLWQQLARRMIQEDKVDVLVAGFASAEREAIRPIVDQRKQLYFYTNQYEGGVADEFTFCTGAVCEQQVIPVMQ